MRTVLPLLVLFSSLGCSGEGGQTGGIGAAECLEDTDCIEAAEGWLSALAAPAAGTLELVSSDCETDETAGTPVCRCTMRVVTSSDEWEFPEFLGLRPECDVYDRSWDCLIPASDFVGCDLEDDASCEAGCAAALDAKQRDAERTFDVEVRTATCEQFACRTVLRVDDRCYANVLSSRVYDCALSDEAILESAFPVPAPCAAAECDAGAGEVLSAETD